MVPLTSLSPDRQLATHLPSTNLVPAAQFLSKQVPLTTEPLGQGGVQAGILEERSKEWPALHLPATRVGGRGWGCKGRWGKSG